MTAFDYHYLRQTDEKGLSHGLCIEFKSANGKMAGFLHATVFEHGEPLFNVNRDIALLMLREQRKIAKTPGMTTATA